MEIHLKLFKTLGKIFNLRLIVLSIIRTLKKIDTVLVSKKELDNANFLINNSRGYRYP